MAFLPRSPVVPSCPWRHGRFSQARSTPAKHFLTLKLFPATVFLHHHVGYFVNAFVAGEAPFAFQAFAPAADDSPSLLSRESTTLSFSNPQKGHFMGAI